ncbi:MAG: hypothetical protein ACR2PA_16215, partial [Hyphomicrobiaceae bacterium]
RMIASRLNSELKRLYRLGFVIKHLLAHKALILGVHEYGGRPHFSNCEELTVSVLVTRLQPS